MNYQKEYLYFLQSLGLCTIRDCDAEENEKYTRMEEERENLPENICLSYQNDTGHKGYFEYSIKEHTEKEFSAMIEKQKLEKLNTIKNSVIFFVVLTCISVGGGLIMFLSFLSRLG